MITSLLAFLLFGVGTAEAPEARQKNLVVIELRFEARVPERLVRLEDVARAEKDPSKVWPEIARTVVSFEADRFITRGKILSRLEREGIPANAIRFSGPAICVLKEERAR